MANAHDIALSRPSRKLSFQPSAGALDAAKKTPRPQWLVRMARWLRYNEAALRLILSTFRALQRVGINVSPNHYYWPIPDIAALETRPWPTDTVPAGLDLTLPRQLQLLQSLKTEFGSEWRFPHVSDGRGGYHYNNGFFETVDAEIAYSFVRRHKPRRIIEVGGGFSTRIMAAAMRVNLEREGAGGELITIDPDPERVSHPSVSLIVSPVQDVSLDLFLSLEAGDILFLDSSHVVGIGSDVVREYLEILPRLNPGVIVHMHDIFLPAEYPRASVVNNLCFWSEQYLLQAFLAFNTSFEVLWGSSAMQIFHGEELERAFPQWSGSYKSMPHKLRRFIPSRDGERVWPSSFWIRRNNTRA